MHDKKFGSGKTTYDVNSILNQGRIPIIISPWEDNYDHDILYLIFDSVRNVTETKKFTPTKDIKILFFVVASALFPLYMAYGLMLFKGLVRELLHFIIGLLNLHTNGIYRTIASIPSYFRSTYPNGVWVVNTIFTYAMFIWFTYVIFKRLLPALTIFKKNYTQVYKSFFVSSIVNMLKRKKDYILLIEDVDRLEECPQKEVFRVLSSINTDLPKKSSIFCLMSVEGQQIEKDMNVLKNKIIYKNWGVYYNDKESMKKYVDENIKLLQRLVKHRQHSYIRSMEEMHQLIENESFNFRNTHTIISNLHTFISEESESEEHIDLGILALITLEKGNGLSLDSEAI